MDKIAILPQSERDDLFQEAANRKDLTTQIIEKDFWVCWVLEKLFGLPQISPHLIFKGGTSLSKVYGVIKRFSEDVDVSISREYFGFGGEFDPLQISGANKRRRAVEEIKEACRTNVQDVLLAQLNESFYQILSTDEWKLTVDSTDGDGQTLLFAYPTNLSVGQLDYLRPIVRIEFGARAEHHPFEYHTIHAYAAEEFPDEFSKADISVKVLAAKRTFWEKATILHDQYHRDESAKTADRISRHYYDLKKLSESVICDAAKEDLQLLKNVVENKMVFFPRAGANYEEVLKGNLRLAPSDKRTAPLRSDYEKMSEMFFELPPSFDEIIASLKKLEDEINSTIEFT